MHFRHTAMASFFSLTVPSSSPSFSSTAGGVCAFFKTTCPSSLKNLFSLRQCKMYLVYSHHTVPSSSLVILAPRKSIPSEAPFTFTPDSPYGSDQDFFMTYLASCLCDGINMVLPPSEKKVINVRDDHTLSERLLRSLNTRVLSWSDGNHRPKTR